MQNDDKSPGGVVAEMQARGELWMDMIATAFACGTRRVAVIQWQGASEGYNPADDMGSPNHHSVTQGAARSDHWVAIDTWYANRFAYQLAALKKLGVLDRTIVVWVSEITEGHNQLNMVTVVAGGQALGMKMGQYIQYPFTGTGDRGLGLDRHRAGPREPEPLRPVGHGPAGPGRQQGDVRRPEVVHGPPDRAARAAGRRGLVQS